jgi:hypothetical protein
VSVVETLNRAEDTMKPWWASAAAVELRGRRTDDDEEDFGADDFEEDDEFDDDDVDDDDLDEDESDEDDVDYDDFDEEFDDDGEPRRGGGGRPRREWGE